MARALADRGHKTKELQVSHAFHSVLMEPAMAEFRRIAAGVTFHEPRIPLVSALTGSLVGPAEMTDPEYWVRHLREPVRFLDAIRTAEAEGARVFLELGPDGVLTSMAADCLLDRSTAVLASTLRKDRPEVRSVLSGVGQAYAAGVDVDWYRVFDGTGARRAELPTYAFDHRRYWITAGRPSTAPPIRRRNWRSPNPTSCRASWRCWSWSGRRQRPCSGMTRRTPWRRPGPSPNWG